MQLTAPTAVPARLTVYGASCGGAALATSTDFAFPGTHLLRLEDPGPIAVALSALGDRRLSIGFPPHCTVLNNLLLALPAPADHNVATLRVRPPPIPGLVLEAQGFVGLSSGLLHLSNGIELACR